MCCSGQSSRLRAMHLLAGWCALVSAHQLRRDWTLDVPSDSPCSHLFKVGLLELEFEPDVVAYCRRNRANLCRTSSLWPFN